MSRNLRERMTLDEAFAAVQKGNMIEHIVKNDDDTFSIVAHIVCEYCDFCEESHNKTLSEYGRDAYLGPFLFKDDIYERVGRI